MNYPMIFSLAALIISILACGCVIWHIRTNNQEHKGMILYSDTTADIAKKQVMNHVDAVMLDITAEQSEIRTKVEALEAGITPDFEKAKAAAEAVNSFNAGISSILGYDPAEVLRNSRNESRGEAE